MAYIVIFPTVHENSICIFSSLSLSFVILTCHSDAHIALLYFLFLMTSYIGFLIGGSQQEVTGAALGLLESAVTAVKGGLVPRACWEPGVTGLTWVTLEW